MPRTPEEKHVFRAADGKKPGQAPARAPASTGSTGRQIPAKPAAQSAPPISQPSAAGEVKAPRRIARSKKATSPAGGALPQAKSALTAQPSAPASKAPQPHRAAASPVGGRQAPQPQMAEYGRRTLPAPARKSNNKKLPLYLLSGLGAVLLVSLCVWGLGGDTLKSWFNAVPAVASGSTAQSGSASAGQNGDEGLAVKAGKDWPAQVGDRLVGQKPQKLVSLSPMITEALLCLPGNEALCGVTEYCNNRGAELVTVGTPLLPRPEAILELSAQYVLCQTPLANGVKEQIEQGGARVIQLETPTDLAGLRRFYGELGAILNGNETGRAQGCGVIDRLSAALALYDRATEEKATALLLPDLSGMAATADTVEWAVLGQVFRHPLPDATGWLAAGECLNDADPDNDWDQLKAADPDLLLVPDSVSPEDLSAALGELRAVQKGAVVYLDERLVETMSPRLIFTVAQAANLAYPGLSAPAAQAPAD